MSKYKLVVWDWDGTLMDTTAVIVESMKYACRRMGLPVPPDVQCASVIGLGWREAILRAVPECPVDRLAEFGEWYREYYVPHESDVTLFPGVKELLLELKAHGAVLAVATGKSRRGLDYAIKATGLEGVFESTQTITENPSKPNPDMLEQIAIETGSDDKSAVVMVGDTTHDLFMARNFGCDAVAVTTGAHPVSELEKACPKAICMNIEELRRALGL